MYQRNSEHLVSTKQGSCDRLPGCQKEPSFKGSLSVQKGQWPPNAAAAAAKSLQSCLTLCDPRDGSPPGSPWDSPGKNTGVGCHFLLQCVKVKSESEVAQSCPTSSDPVDCSLPGSSAHGIFQARVLEWGAIAFSDLLMNVLKKMHYLYCILPNEIKRRLLLGRKVTTNLDSILKSRDITLQTKSVKWTLWFSQ